jgi:hypothetical protein
MRSILQRDNVPYSRQKPGSIAWREIAFEMFLMSGQKYFRNSTQCREKWFNHLSPQMVKTEWTLEEDKFMFELILQNNCRWSLVSKAMGRARTDHQIKNRFNSYRRKWRMKHCSDLNKLYTRFMRSVYHLYIPINT